MEEPLAVPFSKASEPAGFVAKKLLRTHSLNLSDVAKIAQGEFEKQVRGRTGPLRGQWLQSVPRSGRTAVNRAHDGSVTLVVFGPQERLTATELREGISEPRIVLQQHDLERMLEAVWNMQEELRRPKETDEEQQSS